MELSLEELKQVKDEAFKQGYDVGYQEGHEVGYAQGVDYSDDALGERIADLEEELDEVKQNMIKEFVVYVKEAFGVDLIVKSSKTGSDSFEKLFGKPYCELEGINDETDN